jgi:hypothetical protein
MCRFVREVPSFDCAKGVVTIKDETGERAMSLGDFVASTKLANQLCRQWVSEANQASRVRTFERVEAGESGH